MDDDRLTARLRRLEAPGVAMEPRDEFVEELHGVLASKLGFTPGSMAPPATVRRRARPTPQVRRWALIAATVALLIAVVANLATIGATIQRLVDRPSLMDAIRASGSLRVAIRPDDPQILAAGGTLSGFDVDVADAVAARLGLRVERIIQPIDQMLAEDEPTWHIALPSRALSPAEAARYAVSDPYYRWPAYVLVRRSGPADLAGAAVCVVAGSIGERWAAERGDVAAVRARADDDACMADLRAGRVDAMVTDVTLPMDVANDPDLAVLGEGPVAVDPRPILVPRGAADAAELVDAIDATLDQLRADGTLTALSEQRFGGEDLTTRTPTP
jgi:ABC-type amino acid transport substrate-binding protein